MTSIYNFNFAITFFYNITMQLFPLRNSLKLSLDHFAYCNFCICFESTHFSTNRRKISSFCFSIDAEEFFESARFFFNPHVLLTIKNSKYKSTPSWGKIFWGDFNYITVTLSVTFSVTPIIFL